MQLIKNILQKINKNQLNLFIQRKNKIIIDNITFTFLGSGGEGIVYGFIYDNNKYAIKIYKSNSGEKEINIMKQTTNLLDNNISINFVRLYDTLNISNYMISISIMELADGTLEDWVVKNNTEKDWINMILQILHGILIMQKYMNMYHGDMKPKNILYKKLEKPKNILYEIEKNNEIIKFIINTEYIFLISDYGHSETLTDKNKNLDLIHIATLYNRILVNKLMEETNLDKIIKSYPEIEEYYKSEKIKIYSEMKTYPENIKSKMLLRSLLYYLLEMNKLEMNKLEINKLEINKLDINLPPKTIKDILEELYNESTIYDMIIKILIVDYNKYKHENKNYDIKLFSKI